MNKLVFGVLGLAILMGAIVVSSKQWNTIQEQTSAIEKKNEEITYLDENLSLQVKENDALEEENFLLEEHSGMLRDSVMRLQKKLVSFKSANNKQKKYIALVEKKLANISSQYNQLKNQLSTMVQNGAVDKNQMNALIEKQAALLKEIEDLEEKKKWAEKVNTKPNSKIKKLNEVTPPGSAGADFAFAGTQVEVLQMELKKKRFGKALKKVRKGTDWKYSIMRINLDHPRMEMLMDKNFKMKLVDMDENKVISYVESNPNFPNSEIDSKGVGFSYEGQPIELVYYNNDEKSSKNYALQFYYIDNAGKEIIIPGAQRQIINDGKVLY